MAGKISPEEIARHLKRNPDSVKKYMRNKGLMKYYAQTQEKDETPDITRMQCWREIQSQFTKEETESFKYHWTQVASQFANDNILHTEELQIIDMIKLEILMNRVLKQETDIRLKIKNLEKEVIDEKNKPGPDIDLIRNNESQLAALYAATASISKAYQELLKDKNNILKSLKGTRDQRLKAIESNKETMAGYFRELFNNPKKRKELGEYLEKKRLAAKEEYIRLSELHTYADGSVDHPLLTPEIVESIKKGKK